MLKVVSGGALATIQDLGRDGWQSFGVPTSGAMDFAACGIANRLVGNSPDAALIEITAGGAAFDVLESTVVGVTGANLGAMLNHRPLPMWTSVFVRAGSRIEFEGRMTFGARAYVAIHGGIDVPVVLGSRSTYLPGEFGGLYGRALQTDDVLTTDDGRQTTDIQRVAGHTWPHHLRPNYAMPIRILPGPHTDCFESDALDVLTHTLFHVSSTSNRIGLRCIGATLAYAKSCDLPSLGVFPGVIQAPPDGIPILLMADAQTTGGYPIIAVAIQADLPRAAQLLPGDELRFALTTQDEAVSAWRELRAQCESSLQGDNGVWLAANARG